MRTQVMADEAVYHRHAPRVEIPVQGACVAKHQEVHEDPLQERVVVETQVGSMQELLRAGRRQQFVERLHDTFKHRLGSFKLDITDARLRGGRGEDEAQRLQRGAQEICEQGPSSVRVQAWQA
jgi:hypothetical protein